MKRRIEEVKDVESDMKCAKSQSGKEHDKYIFRYQYLLVEIGTEIMRRVFDFKVGYDFVKHLSANNKLNRKFQSLISAKIITADQAQHLPPIDMSPKSTNMDIILLACLLRNFCGLRGHTDPVWKNPPSTDFSLEADLARLGACHRNLQNSGTVFISEADLTVKWNELSQILNRLNNVCGIPNLSSLITDAQRMVIDEDKYIFRYQYLLVEIGTEMMRKVFDFKVGYDFVKHLSANNNKFNKILQRLISAKIITADQAKHLPPIDMSPKSTNMDITLLACLLRNVCGLRGHTHPVWKIPAPIDLSVEADLARLRECRTKLQNRGTVFISEAELTVKWNELSQILNRLNKVCGLRNLYSVIKDVECMNFLEEIVTLHDLQIKAWTEMQHLISEIEQDLRNQLVSIYKEECCSLPVSCLPDGDEDEVEILSIYQPPSLYHVPYHRTQEQEGTYSISSYKELFYKDDRCFRKIYITGDAGVGKTSFCTRMTFLWCKSQCGESVADKSVQNDIDFMAKFDFVFYISLRDTRRKDVVTMIIEQSFCNENDRKKKEIYECVEHILINHRCIIIMDALDEWTPAESGKININNVLSDKCSFVMTCRPYKIENERLLPRDLDRQVQMTGIKESSTKHYVRIILNHFNKANMDNTNPDNFIRDINKCGLQEQLHIPIITSHLIAVWFSHKLTDMSRALVYSSIVDMLLKKVEKSKGIELPSSAESKIQFPDSLPELLYFKKHISVLKTICILSFNLLFKQDKCLSELVFTTEQLQSEPYCISVNEMDFLCKFGILSKSKFIGRFGKRKQKLSFLHKTYLDFFTALFVTSFDLNHEFDNVAQKWTSINDVVQFEDFFLFFVGLSWHKSMVLFEKIYHTISDDLSLCKRNAIFHNDSDSYRAQIKSLQTVVKNCFKDVYGSVNPNISLKLEDFIFDDDDDYSVDANFIVDLLKQILFLNRTCIKSIHSVKGKYYDEFDQIKNLQCLHVGKVMSADYVKFTECMLQNQSTLHTVCIDGEISSKQLIPELPVRSLQHLTSLSLSGVKLQHNSIHNLVKFLCDNVLIENITLYEVSCDTHQFDDNDCTFALNLPHHTRLNSLCLQYVNILCNNINKSNLKYITLESLSERIGSCYICAFNCMKYSQLEHLGINVIPGYMLDYSTMLDYTVVKTLQYIKSLSLHFLELPDDALLQLHPDVTQAVIVLELVTMSRNCFHEFIKSCVNNHSVVKVQLRACNITSVEFETQQVSYPDSMDYMFEYLTSMYRVDVTLKEGTLLHFETRRFP